MLGLLLMWTFWSAPRTTAGQDLQSRVYTAYQSSGVAGSFLQLGDLQFDSSRVRDVLGWSGAEAVADFRIAGDQAFLATAAPDSLYQIDMRTLDIQQRRALPGPSPYQLALSDRFVLVASGQGLVLYQRSDLDAALAIDSIGPNIGGMLVQEDTAYILDNTPSDMDQHLSLAVVDLAQGAWNRNVRLPFSEGRHGTDLLADARQLYVLSQDGFFTYQPDDGATAFQPLYNRVRQAIVASGGRFMTNGSNLSTVRAGLPYTTVDSMGTNSVQEILVAGREAYVLAQDSLFRYTYSGRNVFEVESVAFPGVSTVTIGLTGETILLGNFFGQNDSNLFFLDRETLQPTGAVREVFQQPADILPDDQGQAFITQNLSTSGFSDSAGYILRIDIDQQAVRDTLFQDSIRPLGNLYFQGNTLIALTDSGFFKIDTAQGSASLVQLGGRLNSGGYASNTYRWADTLYAFFEGQLSKYDLSREQWIDRGIIDSAVNTFTVDTATGLIYAWARDFVQPGQGYIFDQRGRVVDSFRTGISAESVAFMDVLLEADQPARPRIATGPGRRSAALLGGLLYHVADVQDNGRLQVLAYDVQSGSNLPLRAASISDTMLSEVHLEVDTLEDQLIVGINPSHSGAAYYLRFDDSGILLDSLAGGDRIDALDVFYRTPVGLPKAASAAESSWSYFPNPATHTLQLVPADRTSRLQTLRVFQADGRQVMIAHPQTRSAYSLPISSLPEGFYILELQLGDRVERHRFMKR